MPDPVVVDTYVFNRSVMEHQEYREVYQALLDRRDRLLVNTQILQEYALMAPKAGLTATFLRQEVFPEWRRKGIWQETANRRVDVGPEQDRPFIGAAIEGRAKYLVSTDRRLRRKPVRPALEGAKVSVVYPEDYPTAPL